MPAGFYNGDIMFADNVSFDGTESPGKVTQNGQLLIGSSVAPNIRIGTLTSTDASVIITNGNGTIDLSATGGGGGITTIDGDSGSITGSNVSISAGNSINNCGSTVKFVNSGTDSILSVTDEDMFGGSTYVGKNAGVVGATAGNNTGFGKFALGAIVDSSRNAALGEGALGALTTGSGSNTALGTSALSSLIDGRSNTCIGSFAGLNYSGTESYNITINAQGNTGESNTTRIGNGTSQTKDCYIDGIYGSTESTSTALPVFVNNVGKLVATPMNVSGLMTIKSPLLNLNTTGNTDIFTLDRDFYITGIGAVGVSGTTTGTPTASFGYSAPNDQIIPTFTGFSPSAGQFVNTTSLGTIIAVPATLPLTINITTAATGTGNTQYLYIQGFLDS